MDFVTLEEFFFPWMIPTKKAHPAAGETVYMESTVPNYSPLIQ